MVSHKVKLSVMLLYGLLLSGATCTKSLEENQVTDPLEEGVEALPDDGDLLELDEMFQAPDDEPPFGDEPFNEDLDDFDPYQDVDTLYDRLQKVPKPLE